MAERTSTSEADRKRLSRTGQAYDVIQQRIMDLTYPPGSTFTEGELASALGLTKTPVREALLMLAHQGLVSARPGAGYLVMPITLKDIRSLCQHWRRLEGDAAAITAGSGLTSHAVMHMSELVKGSGEFADLSLIERDADLHAWVVQSADDEYLARDFQRLIVEIVRLYRLTVGENPEGLAAEQPELLRAVLAGDVERARTAVHDYVSRVEKQVIEVLLDSDVLMSTNLGLPGTGR